jgi:hypothetical protein
MIGLPAVGMAPIPTEKLIIWGLGFNPYGFVDTPQSAAFDFIIVTGGPTGGQDMP